MSQQHRGLKPLSPALRTAGTSALTHAGRTDLRAEGWEGLNQAERQTHRTAIPENLWDGQVLAASARQGNQTSRAGRGGGAAGAGLIGGGAAPERRGRGRSPAERGLQVSVVSLECD